MDEIIKHYKKGIQYFEETAPSRGKPVLKVNRVFVGGVPKDWDETCLVVFLGDMEW